MMGGDIELESATGQGSAFTLRLPLPAVAGQPAELTRPAVAGQKRLAGIRVLAAEDVEVNRLILEDILLNEGASVVFAEHGQQALQRLDEFGPQAFDLVLMDVQMPVMDGYEATRRLRERAPGLPVVGLTAHALAEEQRKCLAAGMAEHVTKPIDPEVLFSAILFLIGKGGDSAAGVKMCGASPTPAHTMIDWSALFQRYGKRRGFVLKLAEKAIEANREVPEKLRQAARAGDMKQLSALAHSLKGAVGSLCAETTMATASSTEAAARQGNAEAVALAGELALQMERLLAELAQAETLLNETVIAST